MMKLLRSVVLLGAIALGGSGVQAADNYPSRPITMLVGFAAGGITDSTARMLAEELSKALGQTVIVDNRPGAGGNIAAAELARAKPDGYTIMLASPGQLVVNPLTQESLGYDRDTQFTLISLANESPFVFVVPPNSPFNSVEELVAWGKENKGKLTFGSPGLGTTMHIGGEMLNVFAGLDAVHVPYRGGAQSTTDLMAGRIDFMIDSFGAVSSYIRSNQLKLLAVASADTLPEFPDVPTLAESYPGLAVSSWLGLVAPPNVPDDIVAKLAEAMQQAVTTPRYIEMLENRGSRSARIGPEAFRTHLERERKRVEDTIVKAGLKLEG